MVYDQGLRTRRPTKKIAKLPVTSPAAGAVPGVGGAAGAGADDDDDTRSQLLQVLVEQFGSVHGSPDGPRR